MFDLDPHIDAALESYPLAPVPPGLVRRTLARLEPRPQIRYRLEFLDLAVPVFVVLFLLLTIWAIFWTLNVVSPFWMLEWGTHLEIARQRVLFEIMHLPAWFPVFSALVGSIALTGMGFIAILLIERSFLALRLRN